MRREHIALETSKFLNEMREQLIKNEEDKEKAIQEKNAAFADKYNSIMNALAQSIYRDANSVSA